MELIKKPVRTYRTIETRETEELFENSIIVPDSKPDVKTLLVVNAECFVSKVEKSGRMLEVGGEIKYRILYLADTPDNRLESIHPQPLPMVGNLSAAKDRRGDRCGGLLQMPAHRSQRGKRPKDSSPVCYIADLQVL